MSYAGTLPATLLTSRNLVDLNASYNKLAGLHSSWEKPSTLTSSTPLSSIDLSHNALQVSSSPVKYVTMPLFVKNVCHTTADEAYARTIWLCWCNMPNGLVCVKKCFHSSLQ